MGFYGDEIVPRIINLACGTAEHAKVRNRACASLDGDVLEIGFGSGLNLPHLPPTVDRLYAVDPAIRGRRLAAARLAETATPVEFVGLNGEDLPLDDASVDRVLSTWTLCTIPDAARALQEVRRVLRPGGTFHFVEHGRSPDARVARWQDRFNPIQQRVAGGCNLNRPIEDLVTASGLEVLAVERYYMAGPKPFVYHFDGTATKR